MAKKRLVVIDGKSVFYRGYYAMPNLSTKAGTPTGGVYGFAVMALEVLKKMKPDYVCVAWDKPKTNIRRRLEIYPLYKANRKPAPPDFYEQVPILHELLDAFGWPLYEIDDHEADDIMATFAAQAEDKGYETILVTSDHDVLQLISDDTTVAILKKGLTNVEMYDEAKFKERYKMEPHQFIDYKSLRGDSSDNIPGVTGVGEKTATELIDEYKTLDEIYENIELIKDTLKKKLVASKDLAYTAKQLVELDKKVPLKLEWSKADTSKTDPKRIVEALQKLEFRALLNQLPENMKVSEAAVQTATKNLGKNTKIKLIESVGELEKLKGPLFIHPWCKGAHGMDAHHFLISENAKSGFLVDFSKIDPSQFATTMRPVLEDKKIPKFAFDSKLTYKALKHLGITLNPISSDLHMGAFLINSLIRQQSITDLAQNYAGYEGEDLNSIPPESLETLAPVVNAVAWEVYKKEEKEFEELPKVKKLAEEIEWPVMPILAEMELYGMKIDTEYLKRMSKELRDMISDIEQTIYGLADQEFNISSPSQLAEVLFEKMGLPTVGIKKGKTGYSTAANELDKLRSQHKIIDFISQYREYTKLTNTYVDVLPKLVDENSRLHTTFSTAVAATGRLSSRDPNLQNIPTRTDIGRKIRRAFVATPGYLLVSADYSQFELRLGAVFAKDDEWIEAFNDDEDIHTKTAAQVYGVALEDVTKEQRRFAKVINFGIMYGMSPHGLNQATGMGQKQAKEFIDRYFETRKPLATYIEKVRTQAHEQGYVETLFGRRRPTPDVKSSNWVVRQSAERAAINLPFQGTEADLMKMAMVAVDEKLPKDAHQVLQIHDSIMVECRVGDAEAVAKMMKETMESIYPKLPIKLSVDVSTGKNWAEL